MHLLGEPERESKLVSFNMDSISPATGLNEMNLAHSAHGVKLI